MTERSVGGGGSCYVCVLVNIAGCVFHPCLLHKHTVCVLGGHSSSRLCPFFFFFFLHQTVVAVGLSSPRTNEEGVVLAVQKRRRGGGEDKCLSPM